MAARIAITTTTIRSSTIVRAEDFCLIIGALIIGVVPCLGIMIIQTVYHKREG